MCLDLAKRYKMKIADKDIVVYKYLQIVNVLTIDSVNDGDSFNGVILGRITSGKIHKTKKGEIFLLTNNSLLMGNKSPEMYGYYYSWILDYGVKSIVVNDKELISEIKQKFNQYETPFQHRVVEIGETYTSDIEIAEKYIETAIHSFRYKKNMMNFKRSRTRYGRVNKNLIGVKCIIPKGSVYYSGKFLDYDAYASNKITYLEIIE